MAEKEDEAQAAGVIKDKAASEARAVKVVATTEAQAVKDRADDAASDVRDEAFTVAERLEERAKEIRKSQKAADDRVEGYWSFSKVTRKIAIRGLVVVFILFLPDFGITGWNLYLTHKETSNTNKLATVTKQLQTVQYSRYDSCRDENIRRQHDLQRWAPILAHPQVPSNETPAARALRLEQQAGFIKSLQSDDQPIDCSTFLPPTTTIPAKK